MRPTREGGKQAVAEAYRNLTATGARPLAATDNLNFGNPEKPEIMGQLVGAIRGIGEACAALDMPIVSGNVSLYNETDGAGDPAHPDHRRGGADRRTADDAITGSGARGPRGAAGRRNPKATWASRRCWPRSSTGPRGRAAGGPRRRDAQRRLHPRQHAQWIRACTDLSDGGLALAAFEMAEAAGVGVKLDSADMGQLFGEDQGRYLVACNFDAAEALMARRRGRGADPRVGRFGGDR